MTLSGWTWRVIVLVSTASCLSGCAAIPAVAGGIAAKKAGDYGATARTRRDEQATARAAPTAPPASLARVTLTSAPSSDRSALPSTAGVRASNDPRPMRPGIAYAGALPPPSGALQPRPGPEPPARFSSSWTDVGRYVAGRMAKPANSVLLMRGSSSDIPAWVPCAGKPRTMIVRLDTVTTVVGDRWQITPAAASWLDAFQTLQIPVVLIGFPPAEARARIEAAFRERTSPGSFKRVNYGWYPVPPRCRRSARRSRPSYASSPLLVAMPTIFPMRCCPKRVHRR